MIRSILFFLMVFTSTSSLLAKNITYTVNGKEYEGYALINDKKSPLVLLVHDWDGINDYEMNRAKMLNDLGYSVFAVDLFGKGIRPTEDKDKSQHTGALYQDRKKMRDLLNAGLKAAAKEGANTKNVVAAGYCFGGAAVLELARSGARLAGFVSFHGGLSTPEGQNYNNTKGKVLVFHGTADSNITMDDFAKLAQELESAKVAHEMISYGGAPHAFTVFNSKAYRKDADTQSWRRFTQFLAETFNK